MPASRALNMKETFQGQPVVLLLALVVSASYDRQAQWSLSARKRAWSQDSG